MGFHTGRAVQRARVWSLSRDAYRSALGDAATSGRSDRVAFLKKVELFGMLSDHALAKVASALTEKTYARGATLVREGDTGDATRPDEWSVDGGTGTSARSGRGTAVACRQ